MSGIGIEAVGLGKRFGGRDVVSGVSFDVPRGGIVGFLGANGAGKSTTMRMLTGYLAADHGTARIAGIDVALSPVDARRHLGYLPEAATGFGTLTVVEFIEFCAEARGLFGARRTRAVSDVCERLDLRAVATRPMRNLSKGLRQRAWLAQALVHDPAVLILDEPTDGLDPMQKVELRSLLRHLARSKAVLMSTHILEEAEELCERIMVLRAGRIVADSSAAELMDGKGRLAAAYTRLTASGPPSDNQGAVASAKESAG
ncbi:MAG: ABC transporter ATP-binding protein [Hyphomicrobiaceae bacterium]